MSSSPEVKWVLTWKSFTSRVSNFGTEEEPVQLCKTGVKAALPIYLSPLQALEFEPNNEKGLFRRGESYIGVNEFELARDDFTKVIQLYPNNKAARTQMAKCQQRIHEQHQREKKIYANMFQRLAEKEEKVRERTLWLEWQCLIRENFKLKSIPLKKIQKGIWITQKRKNTIEKH